MIVGYVRVSTEEQNPDRQIEMLNAKYQIEKLYLDKLSGKNTDRPELQNMLAFVRSGDTVVVESYSRLARSTHDLLEIVDTLKNKDVALISDKENIDTSTPTGKLFLTITAGLAEFERECMLQRQREGIAIAKAAGKYKGRKKIAVDKKRFADVYRQWKEGEITARRAQEKLGLKSDTFYRRVKEYEKNISEVG